MSSSPSNVRPGAGILSSITSETLSNLDMLFEHKRKKINNNNSDKKNQAHHLVRMRERNAFYVYIFCYSSYSHSFFFLFHFDGIPTPLEIVCQTLKNKIEIERKRASICSRITLLILRHIDITSSSSAPNMTGICSTPIKYTMSILCFNFLRLLRSCKRIGLSFTKYYWVHGFSSEHLYMSSIQW